MSPTRPAARCGHEVVAHGCAVVAMGHENMFFAEKELSYGRLNDRLVDRHRRQPHRPPAPPMESAVVVTRGGVLARVSRPAAAPSDGLPMIADGADLLAQLSAEERLALLETGVEDLQSTEERAPAPSVLLPPSLPLRAGAKEDGPFELAPRPAWARRRRRCASGDDASRIDSERHGQGSKRKRKEHAGPLSFDAQDGV